MVDDPRADARAVLGVGPGASIDEIRAAYRRRSRSAHPDAGGSEDEFLRVRAAYETLTSGRTRPEPEPEPRPAGDADRPPRATPTPGAARHAAGTVAPPTMAGRPASASRSGCVVAALVMTGIVLSVVALALFVASSSPPSVPSRGGGSAPDTSPGAFARWRSDHQALVTAIVANGEDIGVALSPSAGAVSVDPLQQACARRLRLLDELDAANPAPRADVTAAITRFVTSERQAMAACLASPPDLDGMASAGARGQADLRSIVDATQA